ncbi:MAG: (E)-4-hydroxy-3-methylbut-2-enyl-diphosphate synthase [Bacteroidales bacterium]|jgi:(E)-4-hydroxy-3-methylbut-2-enyl-diphosphate synthase|nr:(E)-4-hydroxy-3-methylbut-2-enyl-diphosphate synthase [Bacteroidales bacterium]
MENLQDPFHYCAGYFQYSRFQTKEVFIGEIPLGGRNPIRIQSMTNTNTLDASATIAQSIKMIEAGCEYVRITAQSIKEAEHLGVIKKGLRAAGFNTPIIADVHFNAQIALTAARIADKVRINPGNYSERNTGKIYFNEQEYENGLEKIRANIKPLLDVCKTYGTALRIGSNQGSLSERIMSRYGDTPEGMAEAALEFVRICDGYGFHNLVLSMKSSNTRNMVFATRLLIHKMMAEGYNYPLHLGVTEAGSGEDGRIKSAVGIGALLTDGIGDTIRVSLTESPEKELIPAKKLVERFNKIKEKSPIRPIDSSKNPFLYGRLESDSYEKMGNEQIPVVISNRENMRADYIAEKELFSHVEVVSGDEKKLIHFERNILEALLIQGNRRPKIFRRVYSGVDKEAIQLKAATDFGALLIDGLCDGMFLETPDINDHPDFPVDLSFSILQAARSRFSKAEIISCPSCGRTQYDIVSTVERVRTKVAHLTGITIAVMGCIVNGPGEMAGADYGYIGSGKGTATLFKGKMAIKKHIPQEEAVEALVELIKENGDWKEK